MDPLKEQCSEVVSKARAAVAGGGFELILGWRRGTGWDGGQLPISRNLTGTLREACSAALDDTDSVVYPKAFYVDTTIGRGELMLADVPRS